MTSKLVITMSGPAKLHHESFMQMIVDNAKAMVEGFNYHHAGEISMHSHFAKESGRISETVE